MLTGDKHTRISRIDDELDNSSQHWTALSLFRMVWKRKVHIFGVWAVLTAVVITAVKLWPATYRAETLILVDQQKIPEKFVSAAVSVDLQDRLATISQEILSNTQLQKIMESFKLYESERRRRSLEEVLELMRNDIHITTEKGWTQNRPGAFRVSYEGRNPETVAAVTNQLGNLFIEENLRNRETVATGTSDFIKSQMEDAKKNLEIQEKKLSDFKVTYNGELPQQEGALTQELSRLQTQLQGNQDALNRASQNKITVESAMSVAQSTEATLKRVIQSGGSSAYGPMPGGRPKRSEQLEQELAEMRLKYSATYPDVVSLTALLKETKEREKQADIAEAAALSGSDPAAGQKDQPPVSPAAAQLVASQHERIEALNAQLEVIAKELKTRQADQDRILKAIDSVQARLHRLPVREQEMTEVTRDYETSKANYDSLQNKIFAADMATDMERRQKSERFTVVDPARVPEKPISPNRPLFAGLGSFLALGLSLGVWLAGEMRKDQFLGEWELPEGLVVLGRIPALPLPGENGNGKRPRFAVLKRTAAVFIPAAVLLGSHIARVGR